MIRSLSQKAMFMGAVAAALLAGCNNDKGSASDSAASKPPSVAEAGAKPSENPAPTNGTEAAAIPVNRVVKASGLVIEDLLLGEGEVCLPFASVTVNYRGTLEDGKEFDSSYKRGEPASFPLRRVIPGWQEGVPGMRVGGKRRLTIPGELAYPFGKTDEEGNVVIPPNATLVFEVELLATKSTITTDDQSAADKETQKPEARE